MTASHTRSSRGSSAAASSPRDTSGARPRGSSSPTPLRPTGHDATYASHVRKIKGGVNSAQRAHCLMYWRKQVMGQVHSMECSSSRLCGAAQLVWHNMPDGAAQQSQQQASANA